MVAECEHIGKEKKSGQGYQYRGIDDVYNFVHPLLANNKVFCTSEVLEAIREERTTKQNSAMFYTRLKMKYTFWADDGSSISTEVIGEGMDPADKGTNKAMSIAYKYALFQMLCIPTEAIDPDADKKAELQPKTGTQQKPQSAPRQERPQPATRTKPEPDKIEDGSLVQHNNDDARAAASRYSELSAKIMNAHTEDDISKANEAVFAAHEAKQITDVQLRALEKMSDKRLAVIQTPGEVAA